MPRQREVKPWTIYPPTQEDRDIIEQKASEASLSVSAYLCMVGKLACIGVSLPSEQRVLSETQVTPTLKENPKKDDIGAIFETIEVEKEAEDAANPTDPKPFANTYCKDDCDIGGYCDGCLHRDYDEEGRSFCVKYDTKPLTGAAKSEIISAVKEGKAKLHEAYINASDDYVVTRIYNGEQYTVVSNVMDEDIPLTYKEIYTEALRPTLIDDYSVCIQSDGTVTITVLGDCIERSKAFSEQFREFCLTEEDAEHKEYAMELVELDGFMDNLGFTLPIKTFYDQHGKPLPYKLDYLVRTEFLAGKVQVQEEYTENSYGDSVPTVNKLGKLYQCTETDLDSEIPFGFLFRVKEV